MWLPCTCDAGIVGDGTPENRYGICPECWGDGQIGYLDDAEKAAHQARLALARTAWMN